MRGLVGMLTQGASYHQHLTWVSILGYLNKEKLLTRNKLKVPTLGPGSGPHTPIERSPQLDPESSSEGEHSMEVQQQRKKIPTSHFRSPFFVRKTR